MEPNGLGHDWEPSTSPDFALTDAGEAGTHPATTAVAELENPVAVQGPESWQDPAAPGQILMNLEEFSGTLRATMEQNAQIRSEMQFAGQQMSQVFGAMSQLLDMMYEQVVAPAKNQASHPVQVAPESLEPLADSISNAFEEINRRIHLSEDRTATAVELALKQLETNREIEKTAHLTQIESFQTHAKIEVNRLLQVLLIATAFAATGAGAAFVFLR